MTGGSVFPVENGKRVFQENHKKRIGKKRLGKKHSEKTKQIMREKKLNKNEVNK